MITTPGRTREVNEAYDPVSSEASIEESYGVLRQGTDASILSYTGCLLNLILNVSLSELLGATVVTRDRTSAGSMT